MTLLLPPKSTFAPTNLYHLPSKYFFSVWVNVQIEKFQKLELVMDMVVEEVVDKELTKVVEQVNKELVKESNEGLVKVYL